MKLKKYIAAGFVALAGLTTSCSDSFLETDYSRYLDAETVGEVAGEDPEVFLNGIWSWMVQFGQVGSNHDDFGIMSILHSTDMMSEDIVMASAHWFSYDYELDNRMYNYRRVNLDWTCLYTMIAKANEIIAFYPNGATTTGEKGLMGQAYAVRGLSYYYLVQLFQNPTGADGEIDGTRPAVPIMYNATDGKSTEEMAAAKGRNTVADVMALIESDLLKAVALLEDGYTRPSKNFIDANVANGLLARYYLLAHQWQKAADAANKARQGYAPMGNSGLHDGFMDLSNAEWMWGFDHNSETQTTYASFFSHISNLAPGYAGMGYAPRLIDARLYSKISDSDYRKSLFNGPDGDDSQPTSASQLPYANLKFGSTGDWTMDYMYMRAAEMILIEAEAYAHLNNGTKAATVLKELMASRDPQWNKSSVNVEDVYLQRRIELWGEGFAYFDLKRLNKGIDRDYEGSNHLAGYKKVVPAQDVRWVYQIPNSEIQENQLISTEDQND